MTAHALPRACGSGSRSLADNTRRERRFLAAVGDKGQKTGRRWYRWLLKRAARFVRKDHDCSQGVVWIQRVRIQYSPPSIGDRICPASRQWQRKSLFGGQHQEGWALFGSPGVYRIRGNDDQEEQIQCSSNHDCIVAAMSRSSQILFFLGGGLSQH